MATKKDGLPRKAFAYAPTPDPSTWTLPFLDADGGVDPDRLDGAAKSVTEAGIPDDMRGNVKSRLRQAYRRQYGSDVEYPATLHESDAEEMLADLLDDLDDEDFEAAEEHLAESEGEAEFEEHTTPKQHEHSFKRGGGRQDDRERRRRRRQPNLAARQALKRLLGRPPTDEEMATVREWNQKNGRNFIPGIDKMYEDGSWEKGTLREAESAYDDLLDFIEHTTPGHPHEHTFGRRRGQGRNTRYSKKTRGKAMDRKDPLGDIGGRRSSRQYMRTYKRGTLYDNVHEGEAMRRNTIRTVIHEADGEEIEVEVLDAVTRESELSFAEREQMLSASLRDESRGDGNDNGSCWPRAVYDDYLIYEEYASGETSMYRRSYSIVDGEVTLGEPQEVVEQRLWIPVAEAGRRNSAKDEAVLRQVIDLVKSLGLDTEKAEKMFDDVPAESAAAAVVEAAVEPEAITFRESGWESAQPVTLREAAAKFDDAKKMVWITPIKPGWGNARDGFYYTPGALKEATTAGLFNHIKMFKDHPRKSDEKELPERSVKDWFATTREAVWDEKAGAPRVPIQVHDDDVYRRFKEAPEQVAFSVLGGGMARPGKVNGKDGRIVESFRNVRSVDWVTEAGAGGAIDFAESAAAQEHEIAMEVNELSDEQIKAEAVRRGLIREADGDGAAATATKDDAAAKKDDAAENDADAAEAEAKEKGTGATGTLSDAKKDDAEPAATKESDAPAEDPADFDKKVADAVAAALAQRDNEKTMREAARKAVAAELAESTLPKRAKDEVIATFREAAFGNGFVYSDEPALRGAVKGEIAKAARLLGLQERESPVKGLGDSGTDGEPTSVRESVERRFDEKFGPSGAPKHKAIDLAEGIDGGPAPISESGSSVADRMAARIGR